MQVESRREFAWHCCSDSSANAHAGLSNDCLVASSHPLAIRYNDLSVSENHHCSTFTQ